MTVTALEPTLPPAAPTSSGLGGLLALVERAELPLPLEHVTVRAEVTGPVCRTVIAQRFHNPHSTPIEVMHIFPLPEDGAVAEVELVAGETVVRAECREREEAKAVFAAARKAGKRAALLSAERDDVHTLRATNIPPGEAVTVRIVVVEVLQVVDGRWRWRFPTTLAPRFLGGTPTGHDGPGVLPDTDLVPDASRLQPPLRLEGGTTLDLEVHLAGPITALESALHATRLSLEDGGVRVAPSGKATLNSDFVLAFATGDADATAARAWTDGTHTVVSVEPPTDAFPPAMPRDAVFVVDISGSMRGVKMTAAKQALKVALHGLSPGDRFQLIAFDDQVERFASELVDYDDASLSSADQWISALQARGGTVMGPPLQAAFAGERPEGRLRTVLFVTDGQAHNDAELVGLVAGRSAGARLFTLGIDTAVNGALLKRLARVGGGTCELATPRDDIEARVAALEARFGSPLLTGVTAPGSAHQAPTAVFAGRPALLLVEGGAEGLTVDATALDGPRALEVVPTRVSTPLAVAWARARVASLTDRLLTKPFEEEAVRTEVLRIALAHGIASRWTSFVAVEHSRTVDGERIELVQPAELPAHWVPDAPPHMTSGAPRPRRLARSAHKRRPAPHLAPDAAMAMDDRGPVALAPLSAEVEAGASGAASRFFAQARRALSSTGSPAPVRAAAPPKSEPPPAEPGARLAASQSADGSFGGDALRTAAALLVLVLLGHTRRKGLRARSVRKAAAWLAAHRALPEVTAALEALAAAERGHAPQAGPAWKTLEAAGPEGALLSETAA